jgi:Short C-terminal domain
MPAVKIGAQMKAAKSARVAGESSTDVADQIRKLARLRDHGLLTDEEYETKRAELSARM